MNKKKNKELNICPVRHKTARSLVLEYFRSDFPNLTDEQILRQDTEFTVFLNEEWEDVAIVSDLLKAIKNKGLWGFCDHKIDVRYKEIHYWIGKKATTENVLELLSHEVAHAIGNKSEVTAQRYSGVALFAYMIMKEEVKWKKW